MSSTIARVSKAEALIDSLITDGTILPSSKSFLIANMDPFHDKPLADLQGWPDVEATASVVRCIKQSTVITKPSNLGPGNWDVQIVNWPVLDTVTSNITTNRYNNVFLSFTGAGGFGGLCAYAANSGNPITFNVPDYYMAVDATYVSGSSRLIGVGFEVHNTTAELYRQGSAIVWRSPGNQMEPTAMIDQRQGVFYNTFTGNFIRCPPKSAKSALLLPGSRQWQAAEGAYVVGTFEGAANPPRLPNYTVPLLLTEEQDDMVGNTQGNTTPLIFPTGGQGTTLSALATRWYPINPYGVFFQGLSAETSLTVTWNVYIETFPSVAQPDLIVLATPSAPYDPNALELLDKCLSAMPVGVMAKENFLGTWFPALFSAGSTLLRSWLKSRGDKAVADEVKNVTKATKRAAKVAVAAAQQKKEQNSGNSFIAPQNSAPARIRSDARRKRNQPAVTRPKPLPKIPQ